jgi:hypothetical protein
MDELEALLQRNRAFVSARQEAEWGIRALQGSFARLKMPLPADEDEYRSVMIETCARPHQVRTRLVGINQIRTVYEQVWLDGEWTLYEKFWLMLFSDIEIFDALGASTNSPMTARRRKGNELPLIHHVRAARDLSVNVLLAGEVPSVAKLTVFRVQATGLGLLTTLFVLQQYFVCKNT